MSEIKKISVVENVPTWALTVIESGDTDKINDKYAAMVKDWIHSNNIDGIWPIWYFGTVKKSSYWSDKPQFGKGPQDCCSCLVTYLD